MERWSEMNRKFYSIFVDLDKIFNTVNWESAFKTSKEVEINYRDMRVTFMLYRNKYTKIIINENKSEV